MGGSTARDIGAVILLWLFSGGAAVSLAAEDAQNDTGTDRIEVVDGVVQVRLTTAQEAGLALRVMPAAKGALSSAQPALAQVIDLAPLLALRHSVRQGRARLAQAEAERAQGDSLLARLAALRAAGGAVSPDEQASAEHVRATAAAEATAARTDLQGLAESARYRWGAVLAEAAQASVSSLLDSLATGRAHLLLVTPRPTDPWRDAAPRQLQLAGVQALHGQAAMAGLLGPAAAEPLAGQAPAWWAVAEGLPLRVGMRMSALPEGGEQVQGATLAESALVWHAGRRWFYVALPAHRFERREAMDLRVLPQGGWLMPGLEPATPVVVTGAQSLLGEELRWSIPAEGDD